MKPEDQALLRAPFPEAEIGKRPRITCKACSESRARVCDRHDKSKCGTCGNWISNAHMHLDYVGHAETTDRLLSVDPQWSWEPLGLDEMTGLPSLDQNSGLWIRLTVAGHSRIGYGHAGTKIGGDAVKESIGDAIRNAAMRFGVALDLWRKTEAAERVETHSEPEPERIEPVTDPEWLTDAGIAITEAKTTTDLATVADFIKAGVTAGKCSDDARADLLAKWKQKEQELAHVNP